MRLINNDYFNNIILRISEVLFPLLIVFFLLKNIGAELYGLYAAQYVWYVGTLFVINLGFDVATADLLKIGLNMKSIIKSVLILRLIAGLSIFPLLLYFTNLSNLTLLVVVIDAVINTRFVLLNKGELHKLLIPTILLRSIQFILVITFFSVMNENIYVLSFALVSMLISTYIWSFKLPYNFIKPIISLNNCKEEFREFRNNSYLLLYYSPMHISNYFLLRSHLLLGSILIPSSTFGVLELLDRLFSVLKLPMNALGEVFIANNTKTKNGLKFKKIHGFIILLIILVIGNIALIKIQSNSNFSFGIELLVSWFTAFSTLLYAEWITNFYHLPNFIRQGKREWMLTTSLISSIFLIIVIGILYYTKADALLLTIITIPYMFMVTLRQIEK